MAIVQELLRYSRQYHRESMEIRRLTESDAESFRKLRLEALDREPTSFAESVEEFQNTSVEACAERLRSGGMDRFVFGAIEKFAIVGMAGFYRESHLKYRHKGRIWGVYVTEEYRGRGVGRALLTQLLQMNGAYIDEEHMMLELPLRLLNTGLICLTYRRGSASNRAVKLKIRSRVSFTGFCRFGFSRRFCLSHGR